MKLKIERNKITGGFNCRFEFNGNKYYADVSTVPACGYDECMIFKYKKNGKVDWLGVYENRNVVVSEHCLKNCIEEFTGVEWESEE